MEEATLEDATEAYTKYKRGEELGSGNLKVLVKFVVMLENHRTNGREGFSQYCSSKENMWKRLRRSPWESYLVPSTAMQRRSWSIEERCIAQINQRGNRCICSTESNHHQIAAKVTCRVEWAENW
jgi:hypothetical protein